MQGRNKKPSRHSDPDFDFLSHLMTNNDDNDNNEVLNNVSPYDNVDSNCVYIDEIDFIREFKDKKKIKLS